MSDTTQSSDPESKEAWFPTLAEYRAAAENADREAKVANADFAKATAPAKAERDAAEARIEAEYQAKVREAKAELSATTRRVKAQLSDYRLRRDALMRAEERKFEGLRAPFVVTRRNILAPLKAARDAAWAKYRKARWGEE